MRNLLKNETLYVGRRGEGEGREGVEGGGERNWKGGEGKIEGR